MSSLDSNAQRQHLEKGTGGTGGDAEVHGDHSSAVGGRGGEAVIGDGGRGGNARVTGNRSTGIGGRGGRGGIGPGQPGGDIVVDRDDLFSAGGQGGEANQADGRGGRGGRAFRAHLFDGQDRGHLKPPYGRPHIEPGRGGDAPDSPQYMARKLVVMALKERYFIESGIEPRDTDTVWYDRKVVPLDWLNETLRLRGHRWTISVVEGEYEFADIHRRTTARQRFLRYLISLTSILKRRSSRIASKN
ncbi:hypothetical protein LMG31841_01165 [Paraburkholderia saeva]|uniref:Uncharacterized protein n=1 Tax=Paraburkholderia saeva TaxID=2777537 RepID=A0A9N8RUJ7_9BURK|nr:hypothetical protein LMG31841_01165 [Paraburkholderia saeva]CAG4914419.1 hypothetical protein R70241_04236 [Paraburkholderia saeva]